MSVDHCSLWFEGSWAHCCAVHDASALDVAAALDLGRCVATTGHAAIGVAMAAAVIVFGRLYLTLKYGRSAKGVDSTKPQRDRT